MFILSTCCCFYYTQGGRRQPKKVGYKSIDWPGGQIIVPLIGETLFTSVHSSSSLVYVFDPLRAFFRQNGALEGPSTPISTMPLKIQRNKDTLSVVLGKGLVWKSQNTLKNNWCKPWPWALVGNTLVIIDQSIAASMARPVLLHLQLCCMSAYQTDQCDHSECYFPSKYAASINQYYIGIGPTQSWCTILFLNHFISVGVGKKSHISPL